MKKLFILFLLLESLRLCASLARRPIVYDERGNPYYPTRVRYNEGQQYSNGEQYSDGQMHDVFLTVEDTLKLYDDSGRNLSWTNYSLNPLLMSCIRFEIPQVIQNNIKERLGLPLDIPEFNFMVEGKIRYVVECDQYLREQFSLQSMCRHQDIDSEIVRAVIGKILTDEETEGC